MKKKAITGTDSLKLRVARCKSTLLELGLKKYLKLFVEKYPKYNNINGITKATAVFQLRAVDESMTNEIELFTEELNK